MPHLRRIAVLQSSTSPHSPPDLPTAEMAPTHPRSREGSPAANPEATLLPFRPRDGLAPLTGVHRVAASSSAEQQQHFSPFGALGAMGGPMIPPSPHSMSVPDHTPDLNPPVEGVVEPIPASSRLLTHGTVGGDCSPQSVQQGSTDLTLRHSLSCSTLANSARQSSLAAAMGGFLSNHPGPIPSAVSSAPVPFTDTSAGVSSCNSIGLSNSDLRRWKFIATTAQPASAQASVVSMANDDMKEVRSLSVMSIPSPEFSERGGSANSVTLNPTQRPGSGLLRFRVPSASVDTSPNVLDDPLNYATSPMPYVSKKEMPQWRDEDFLPAACPWRGNGGGNGNGGGGGGDAISPEKDAPLSADATHVDGAAQAHPSEHLKRLRVAFAEEPVVTVLPSMDTVDSSMSRDADTRNDSHC
jgi:hypothetical protein